MMFAMQYNVHKKTRRVIFYRIESCLYSLFICVCWMLSEARQCLFATVFFYFGSEIHSSTLAKSSERVAHKSHTHSFVFIRGA